MSSFISEILFENDDIVIVNKRPGIPVIPGRGISQGSTLLELMELHSGLRYLVVHRLDKDTSGAIIFAKNASAHRLLNIQFEKRRIEKMYLALVSGSVSENGKITQPIKEFGSGRMGVSPDGKYAATRYVPVKTFDTSSLLEVYPETGRRHQIRVHCYSIGHPVMGDTVYGKDRPVGAVPRLMLHAHRISFDLPDSKRMTITAKTDEQWETILNSISSSQIPSSL